MAAANSNTDRWSQLSEFDDDDHLVTIGRIHGLRARADLNGKLARAVRFIQSKGRWALVVDGVREPASISRPLGRPLLPSSLPITLSHTLLDRIPLR